MGNFVYHGSDGTGRGVTGKISARSRAEALAELRKSGLVPWRLDEASAERKGVGTSSLRTLQWTRPPGPRQLSAVSRQLAGLLRAGLPIDQALSLVSRLQRSPQLRKLLDEACHEVKQGSTLASALVPPTSPFPRFGHSIIQAGESSGDLAGALETLSDVMDRTDQLRSTVRSGLAYPLFTLGVSAVSVFILVTFVVPAFASIFDSWGETLPLPTRILVAVSTWMRSYGVIVAVITLIGIIAYVLWTRTPKGRLTRDRWLLQMPFVGPMLQSAASARLARTFGAMQEGGVPLSAAFRLASEAAGNTYIAQTMIHSAERVNHGADLAGVWREQGVLSPVVIELAAIGSETGELGKSLFRGAQILEEELERTMKLLSSLLEPVLIVVMAGVVGYVVLSILLPILSLGSMPMGA